MNKQSTKTRKTRIVLPILALFAIILLVVFLSNKTFFVDLFKGIGYNPTPDMLSVRDSLALTNDGARIFNATHPILASRDDFNESCESHNQEVSVLGCYTNDRVYVYNIDDEKLTGIRESTSAHELLHAVWTRLSGLEKTQITPLLESVYAEHPELKETIDSYAENEQLNELYVRVGTQIAELPAELETHYSKYFSDQDAVVEFYNSYIAPFNELKKQIEDLGAELETMKQQIEIDSASLDARLASLEQQIKEFNRCAETSGCFSEYNFYSRRAELVAEQSAINAANDALNTMIDAYNQKVDTYNSSIIRSTELQNLINSNSPETVIKE